MNDLTRRRVLQAGVVTGAALVARPLFAQTIPDRGPRLDMEMVRHGGQAGCNGRAAEGSRGQGLTMQLASHTILPAAG